MAETFKILGQSIPLAQVLTNLYVVPSLTSSVISSLVVCNQSSIPTIFRISLAIAGAADTPAQYIYYNLPIAANDTFIATIGGTLATTDIIRVHSDNGLVSFNVLGSENT
jgi:hypothetical protein